MKFKNITKFQKLLQKQLGADLLYSLNLDNDVWHLTVAFAKNSDRQFKDGSFIHRCKLTEDDMEKHIYLLSQQIVNIFEPLIEKRTNNESIERVE